jgi:SNF2 family DNA or RNA helicase
LENHLGELHAQVTWTAAGVFGTRASFDTFFVKPIIQGDRERSELLRRRLQLVLLRRTKQQVATDLPPRSESVMMVELGARQRALYESIRLAMDARIREVIAAKGLARSGIEVIEALLRLRQVACDPALLKTPDGLACAESAKLETLAEMLPTMVEDGRRILIFSQFTSFLDRIEDVVLQPANLTWLRLDGQTRNRQVLVDRFQAKEVPIFLLSLKAGGTGLTLTAADTVILADPWWNPAVEAQAADRAHRIGQTQPVLVYRLVAAATIEEKVLALQARKRALADALYDETGQSLGSLTAEDLAALLAPIA